MVFLAALASAAVLNTSLFNSTLASESYISLLATAPIILAVVNKTLYLRPSIPLTSPLPNSLFKTAGRSSPSFKNPSRLNLSPIFLSISNGFLLSTFPKFKICLIIVLE